MSETLVSALIMLLVWGSLSGNCRRSAGGLVTRFNAPTAARFSHSRSR